MDEVESLRNCARLARLDGADELPGAVEVRQRVLLLHGFLEIVLADDQGSGVDRGPDGIWAERLGYGHHLNAGGVTIRGASGCLDAGMYGRHAFGDGCRRAL